MLRNAEVVELAQVSEGGRGPCELVWKVVIDEDEGDPFLVDCAVEWL
jgi:hypothetical protein